MSEHSSVKGNVDYWHLPYREEGFSYCRHCKRYTNKLEINFNEGICNDWMQVNCGRCKKAIWICSFAHLPEKNSIWADDKKNEYIEGVRLFVRDNKKCSECEKPTNHYDCAGSGGFVYEKKTNYWCSRKCMNRYDKRMMAKLKKMEKKKK